MKRDSNICASCRRDCTLRCDRILYCDSYIGQHGERLQRKRSAEAHCAPIHPKDVGLRSFYKD